MAALASPSPSPNAGRIPVSKLVTDAIQSLRPWPVEITLAGREFQIPALPAADWLAALMVERLDLEDVLPGLLDDVEAEVVEETMLQGLLSVEDKDLVSLEVITIVSGRPWWVALRLIETARNSWDALGSEMVSKVDASKVSLSAWLDALFAVILTSIEESKRLMFQMKLEVAPEGFGPKPEELTMGSDTFMSMAGDG